METFRVSDSKGGVPNSPSVYVDRLWQVWVAWAESLPAPDPRQSIIKYRTRLTTGQWEPKIHELDLGPSFKATGPSIAAKGRSLVIVYQGIDRANPADKWDIRETEIPNLLP